MAVDTEAIGQMSPDAFHAMPSDSSTALVAFGAKSGGGRHFHFFKTLKPLQSLTRLLVRDPGDNWYNAGLPGAGGTPEEVAVSLERMLTDLGATRVITCGSSMGGYAAILFGCMIGAERAVAISPQTLLDPLLPHAPPAGLKLSAPDLEPVIAAAPGTRIELLAGWDELLDIFHAERVAAHPSVRVLAIPGGHHLSIKDLHRDGALVPLLTELIEGGTPRACIVEPRIDSRLRRRIAETVFAGQRAEWPRVVESIAPVVECEPGWAGPSFHYGRALIGLGDRSGAEEALASAVEANGRWVEPRGLLAEVLRARGRPAEAEAVVRGGLVHHPDWWQGYVLLADCLLEQDREEEAVEVARRVTRNVRKRLAENPGWARGHLALSGALRQQNRLAEARVEADRASALNPHLSAIRVPPPPSE